LHVTAPDNQRTPSSILLCYLGPYYEALRRSGVQAEESALFGAASGPAFCFDYLHDGAHVVRPQSVDDGVSIDGVTPVRLDALRQFGLAVDVLPIVNEARAANAILERLRAGQTLIVYLDVFFLPYHPYAGQLHGQASLVLFDIDEPGRTVGFIDPYVKTTRVERIEGRLAMSDVESGLAQGALDTRYFETCTPVSSPAPVADLDLSRCAQDMLSPTGRQAGIEGIVTLAEDVLTWTAHASLQQRMRGAYLHVVGRGGPAKSRLAWARCVELHLGNVELVQQFERAAEQWAAFAANCFRCSVRPSELLVERAHRQLLALAEVERAAFEALAGSYEGRR